MSERFEVRKYGHAVPVASGTCENCGRPVRYNLAASIVIHVGGGEPNDCREPWPAANIEAAQIDGAALEVAGVAASTNEASTPRSVESVPRVDGSGASATPSGAAISDETVGLVAAAISVALEKGGYGYWINTTPDPDLGRAALDALVASGYRREADVQAEIAATFRSAAAGRREYADGMPRGAAWEPSVELLNMQATTLESAALVAEGNLEPLYNWLPSRRWTDEMMANLYRDRATALEQAQPLLAAAGHSERCGKIGALRPTANRDDSETVTLGPCPLPPGHDGRCDLRSPLPVADGSEVEPVEPCGSDIGVFQPRTCVLPKGHGGDWHDDGSACWSVKEPSDG